MQSMLLRNIRQFSKKGKAKRLYDGRQKTCKFPLFPLIFARIILRRAKKGYSGISRSLDGTILDKKESINGRG